MANKTSKTNKPVIMGTGNSNVSVNTKANTITITFPIATEIHQSASGKTMLVGAWRGEFGFTVDGRLVHGSAMAYYYPEKKQ